jgi:hypothetical protein
MLSPLQLLSLLLLLLSLRRTMMLFRKVPNRHQDAKTKLQLASQRRANSFEGKMKHGQV